MSNGILLGLFLLAYLAACSVAFFIWVKPNRSRLSPPLLLLVFVAAGLSGFLAGFVLQPWVERWLQPYLFHTEYLDLFSGTTSPRKLFADQLAVPVANSRPAALLNQIIAAGLIEESLKLLVVLLLVFWRRDFTLPIQGLVYGIAAALGFGCSEALYHQIDDLFLHPTNRGFNWVPLLFWGHPGLSCFWAVALGYAKFLPGKLGFPLVVLAFMASVSFHGLANFLLDWGGENRRLHQDWNKDWPLDWAFLLHAFLLVALIGITIVARRGSVRGQPPLASS